MSRIDFALGERDIIEVSYKPNQADHYATDAGRENGS